MARIRSIKPEFWEDTSIAAGNAGHWVYCAVEAGTEESGPCKIGVAKNYSKRLYGLQTGNWRCLGFAWLLRVADVDVARDVEEHVLRRLRPNPYGDDSGRLCSEWVLATPGEALELAVELLEAGDAPIARAA